MPMRYLMPPDGSRVPVDDVDTTGMRSPVRCTHCGGVYDVGRVTVTARYSDCPVWVSPCCKRTVDDRGPGWKSRPDIEWLRGR